MSETYLNGKITVSSLAAPTAADIEKVRALSDEERRVLFDEALDKGHNSPVGNKSPDDIWHLALKRAKASQHAL